MSDQLADDLTFAVERLSTPRDKRFAQSLLEQHKSGKPLSANQMHWARTLIELSGKSAPVTDFGSIAADIFNPDEGGTTLGDILQDALKATKEIVPGVVNDNALKAANDAKLEGIISRILGNVKADLVTQNDTREANLSARQEAFNKNAAKSIASACVDEALKRLDARVPRNVTITVARPDGSTHTSQGPQHPQFEELLRMATLRKDDGYAPGIFLAGERGSGKTTGCRNAANALGMKWYANGAISMSHEMLGWIDGSGAYHRTPFRDAFEHGGWYTFDEVDRSDPNALLAVNPHLANGEAAFPDGIVRRHKDCIITATGNTWGLGASLEFSGACKLDEAFLSRFEVKLEWNVDRAFERKLVANPAWMDYVDSARTRLRDAGVKYTIDSRAAIAGAKMISQLGYTFDKAASQTYLASLKPDQRKIVQGLSA